MNKIQDLKQIFSQETGLELKTGVSLSEYSSFRIGGPAEYFFEARQLSHLIKAVETARKYRFPFYVIGGGYNLLFDDAGYNGLIIRNLASGLSFSPEKGWLEVHSGTYLGEIINLTISAGLGGLEFLAGIPGTAGGAIYGNAGAFGQAIGDRVVEVVLLGEKGQEIILKKSELHFGYRHSDLKKNHRVILKAYLKVEQDSSAAIKKKVQDYLERRSKKHPPRETACAGSFFKNPVLPDGQKIAAGYLLEQVGAKGMRVGQAAVFPGHCNFIINLGGAIAHDVLSLAAELKERVWKKFGLLLEEEVIYIPATASMI
ncbi:MAG: UDP-N-acetylmuramate dehydrogenase [Candidatus Aminicenantes bacterium]|nr:UDP-N-acetylmuramate dehydrogenase [Candidatus Aminicenantes bacterium]